MGKFSKLLVIPGFFEVWGDVGFPEEDERGSVEIRLQRELSTLCLWNDEDFKENGAKGPNGGTLLKIIATSRPQDLKQYLYWELGEFEINLYDWAVTFAKENGLDKPPFLCQK